MVLDKLWDIATHKLSTIKNKSNVFVNETIKGPNSDGLHKGDFYYIELYNGSKIRTFNGDPTKNVGYRCDMLLYDESGKIPRTTFALMNPFIAIESGFTTGKINQECYPEALPKQIIQTSSAEDIDTYLFDSYKFNAMKMLEGDPNYFVVDLNCEMSLHPSINGNPTKPLISKQLIDDEMAKNEVKALREWYNLFDKNNGEDSVVRRSTIERNYVTYKPTFDNPDGKEHYCLCYDPAEKIDNSFCLVGRVYHDEELGWMGEVVNGINFMEKLPDGTKKVLAKPQQVEEFKKLMIRYNGSKLGAKDWENLQVYIDAGAGGGGFSVATYLLDDFVYRGEKHFGIIDKQDKDLSLEALKFPNARDILHLPSAAGHKVEMYAAVTDLIEQNLIKFPRPLNLRQEFEYEIEDSEGHLQCRYEKAAPEEIRAMTELDMMITEVTSMERAKTPNGNIQIRLAKNLERKLHDDRAYCLALFCWHIYTLRLKERLAKEREANAWKRKYEEQEALNLNSHAKAIKNPFSQQNGEISRANMKNLFR